MEVKEEESSRLAEDRTVLANERTYTAWIRTGIAALASGVAFEAALSDGRAGWAISVIAAILIVFSLFAFIAGIWHYTHLGLRLQRADIRRLPIRTLIVITAALCLASLTALAGLFIL